MGAPLRAAVLATALACSAAFAAGDPVAEREHEFKASKRTNAAIKAAIARGDAATVAASADELAAFAARLPSLFPPDSRGGLFSGAKAEIWNRFPDFVEHAQAFEAAARALARQARETPADASALRERQGRLNESCAACHRAYKRGW